MFINFNWNQLIKSIKLNAHDEFGGLRSLRFWSRLYVDKEFDVLLRHLLLFIRIHVAKTQKIVIKNCDFVAYIEKLSHYEMANDSCSVDMETVSVSVLSPLTKLTKAMSFNENNYSVNYLIWDQETISTMSTFFSSAQSEMMIKIMKNNSVAMGQKNVKFVSPTSGWIEIWDRSRWN